MEKERSNTTPFCNISVIPMFRLVFEKYNKFAFTIEMSVCIPYIECLLPYSVSVGTKWGIMHVVIAHTSCELCLVACDEECMCVSCSMKKCQYVQIYVHNIYVCKFCE